MRRTRPVGLVAVLSVSIALALVSSPASVATDAAEGAGAAPGREPPVTDPVAVGRGGAVSSVDPVATRVGLRVLEAGGTAADAAVATAAALGVTEPYSAGLGGGGFFVHYDSATGEVTTLDGRETAPAAIDRDAFINPETDSPYPFFPTLVTSGVSVGVPGTPLVWQRALRRFGSLSLAQALDPAADVAERGFVVDETFALQTEENALRFRQIVPTRRLFLPGGDLPAVGSRFRNPDLAGTYRALGRRGVGWLYEGALGAEVVDTVRRPPVHPDAGLPVPPGEMTRADLRDYTAPYRPPTSVGYRGLRVYGMGPPSSGGSTVGESLNILERLPLGPGRTVRSLHLYLEASALAYADRAVYLGDGDYVNVPLANLLSGEYAERRACEVDLEQAAAKPVPAGNPDGIYPPCEPPAGAATGSLAADREGRSTTHLTVVDRWGDVVAYTLTIEQTGGSGIVVPGRGFLLNNELTDFSLEYEAGDPNRIQPGKRPRSSMSPTIVTRDGDFWLALGSPGGSTIITTVLQVLLNRIDLDMNLADAIREPRANQANTPEVLAEQAFIDLYGPALEQRYGHAFVPSGAPGTSDAEIGKVAAVEVLPDGQLLAVAEPQRGGGGHAAVVSPR